MPGSGLVVFGPVATFAATILALAAACSYAVAAVVQQRVARTSDRADSMHLRLLVRLARRPQWVLGVGLQVLSYGFQATALFFGPIVLVAPLAALDLLFALPLVARGRRIALRFRDWLGVGCVAGGVAIFLVVAPPSAGVGVPPFTDWVPLLAAVGAVLFGGVAVVRRTTGMWRAAILAGVGAVEFGLIAALSKSFVESLRDRGWGALGQWEPYALLLAGVLGTLLAQSAYQAGSLAVSLPIIDTVEPISGVVIGATIFHEQLASSPHLLAAQLLGAALAVAGIVAIDRSPLVRSDPQGSPEGGARVRSRGHPGTNGE